METASRKKREPLLVDVPWLRARLDDPSLRLVDLRGGSSHRAGHLPGAVALAWESLVDPVDGSVVGAPVFAGTMSAIGIGDDHLVVAYEQHEPVEALSFVYALRRYGHARAFALSGGAVSWIAAGQRLSRGPSRAVPASFTARLAGVS